MKRRGFWVVALVALAACQGTEPTQSIGLPDQQPSSLIVDGARAGGNPDFFWLFPMVTPPIKHPNYEKGKANGELRPDLFICALDAATAAVVNAATPCKSPPGYSISYLGLTPGFHFTSLDDDIGQYHQYWPTPNSPDLIYRIRAKVGLTELGYIDVFTGKKLLDFVGVNKNLFTTQLDGTNMLIRFRIEQFALCPIARNCASEAVNLALGGNVTAPLPGTGEGGVDIPPQGTGPTTTVTVKPCDATDPGFTDMNPAITDLPTFGPCVTVTATPPLGGALANDATVFICDIHPVLPIGMDHEQTERITLHRFDNPSSLTALPHAPHVCQQQVGSAGSIKGVFASLARGSFKSAGRQLVSMLSPRALYASTMLDVGAGGFTDAFSAYQFALPVRLRIVDGDGQVALPGVLPINPKVRVEDVNGDSVAGARVRFGSTLEDCLADPGSVTGANGLASRPWTIVAGTNYLRACGRGLGGEFPNNGPRSEEDDPFQPIQDHFDGFDLPGGPFSVPVLTGSVMFSAEGVLGDVLPIAYGSSGWSYQIDGSTPPVDWFSSAVSPFSSTGAAPFGAGTGCPLNNDGWTTHWPSVGFSAAEPTYLYARKTFAILTASTVRIGIAIDNDVQVFLNNSDITSSNLQLQVPVGGMLLHEGCPTHDSYTFQVLLQPGTYILGIRARDRGTEQSYMDANVTIVP